MTKPVVWLFSTRPGAMEILFDEMIMRIRQSLDNADGSYKTMFNRVKDQCSCREVISDRTIYCGKRSVHRAYRDNCVYRDCPLIFGKK